jgi:predicted RNA-binding Zn-ribbon protein involved in translation (DUF1610 family)
MYGRYGADKLNNFLIVVGLVVSVIGSFTRLRFLILIPYILYIYVIFRILSKNIAARQKENVAFLKVWNPVVKWIKFQKRKFDDRKTYTYFKCPNCHQQLRAPKGRGKIQVTCQKCRKEFIKKV